MNAQTLIETHLRERIEKDHYPKGYPFVTISREAGAGGHSLAERIVERADARGYEDLFRGWKACDETLAEVVAEDPSLHVSLQELVAERYHSMIQDYLNDLIGHQTPQYQVFKKTFEVMNSLAVIGKVILVGRGGRFVTAEAPGGIHIRLVAPLEVRVARTAERFGISQEEAGKRVRRQDHDRTKLVQDFFNKDIASTVAYDQVYCTQTLSLDECADGVLELIQEKAEAIGRD